MKNRIKNSTLSMFLCFCAINAQASNMKPDYESIVKDVEKAKEALESKKKTIDAISKSIQQKEKKITLHKAERKLKYYDKEQIEKIYNVVYRDLTEQIKNKKLELYCNIDVVGSLDDGIYINSKDLKKYSSEINEAHKTMTQLITLKNKVSMLKKYPSLILGNEREISILLQDVLSVTKKQNSKRYQVAREYGSGNTGETQNLILVKKGDFVDKNIKVSKINKNRNIVKIEYAKF